MNPPPWWIELTFGLIVIVALLVGYWGIYSARRDIEKPLFAPNTLIQNNDRTISDLSDVDGINESTNEQRGGK